MNTYYDLGETNRNILSEENDIELLKSLIGRRCLVKRNKTCQSYDTIIITGYADGVVRYHEETNGHPMYVNRYDFFPIVMPMPNFGGEPVKTMNENGCQFTY